MLFVGCDLDKLISVSKADYNLCGFNKSDSINYLIYQLTKITVILQSPRAFFGVPKSSGNSKDISGHNSQ